MKSGGADDLHPHHPQPALRSLDEERGFNGEFPPGTQLVNRTLAKEIGSSFIPVREAISRLASDRLAASGLSFTDAYAACAVCSPTRASILTGKYPARLLLTQWLPAGRWNPQKNGAPSDRHPSKFTNRQSPIISRAERDRARRRRPGGRGRGASSIYPVTFAERAGHEANPLVFRDSNCVR